MIFCQMFCRILLGFMATRVAVSLSPSSRRPVYSHPLRHSLTSHSAGMGLQDDISQGLMEWFQGDFDNYPQVVDDRMQNLEPREGGGHEHFHCTLVPVSGSSRLAAFFFDGNPDRIFRFRYYQFVYDESMVVEKSTQSIEMQLYTLHPHLEKLLRTHSSDPVSWPGLFNDFEPNDPTENKLNLLPKCEIVWSREKDTVQHAYAIDIPDESTGVGIKGSLHAVMVHGEAIVNSTIVPGMAIRILDQLSLYSDVFYINDRGFDPVTGAFIYGNQRGVPYRLERVSHFLPHVSTTINKLPPPQLKQEVSNTDLAWTLGPQWRTEEEYIQKIQLIGGHSSGINKKRYQSPMKNV
jgi:hypothetical protein